MKVQANGATSTLIWNQFSQNVENNKQEVWKQEDLDGNPVQVTITKEGLDSLRNSVDEIEGEQTYEDFDKMKDIWSKLEINLYAKYNNEMISSHSKSKSQSDDGSIKSNIYNSVYNSLDYYGNKYDEIVKGYENGTREIWVTDQNSELGYRKLTKEEDLDALDKVYERNAEFQATSALLEPIAKKAKIYTMQQLADVRGYKMSKADTVEEEPIENLYERMMESRNAFKIGYSAFSTQDKVQQNISALVNQIFSSHFTN
ncbi:hypothetical protein C8E03_102575 [Lachnotalea glycerini]|uniref:Uncharacterized protein n=1 Tax=Lachnotalea glycerini TaxID=1763509 RepID=A0A318EW81_9FIRM|nr:hypothetical protein [Lachnotalea glycerini]PXV93800.1 hypothetical protein C8E03_102575 [Lachnotalea glycerini]